MDVMLTPQCYNWIMLRLTVLQLSVSICLFQPDLICLPSPHAPPQAMQEFTDLEFSWNEERAALEAQATQLREELAAAHSAVAAAKDKDSSEGSADVLAGLQVQLEGYMAQVASLQQQLQVRACVTPDH